MSDTTLTVSTDQLDYAPDSTATFTATNLAAGGTIQFLVTDVNGTAVTGTNEAWTVTDGGAGDLDGVANGIVVTSWHVGQDALNEAFVLTATNTDTGETATAAFTDANKVTIGTIAGDDIISPTEASGGTSLGVSYY